MASAFPSFTQSVQAPSSSTQTLRASTSVGPKRGLLGRFLDALVESCQRETEQRMARLLAQSGGKLTDSLEREADRRSA